MAARIATAAVASSAVTHHHGVYLRPNRVIRSRPSSDSPAMQTGAKSSSSSDAVFSSLVSLHGVDPLEDGLERLRVVHRKHLAAGQRR